MHDDQDSELGHATYASEVLVYLWWWYGGEEEVATLCRIRGKECKHGGSLEQKGQRESRGSR